MRITRAILLLTLFAATTAQAAEAIEKTKLARLEFPDMKGWFRRTQNTGVVNVADGHVELGPQKPGDDSILQCDVKLAETDVARVAFAARWRVEGVVGGEAAYQRAGVQARFTSGGKEIGGWVDIAKADGTTAWAEVEIEADVPQGADGLFVRVFAYGCKSGRVLVSKLLVEGIGADAVAAHRLRFRPAQEYGDPVPASRIAKMARGVNINNWFCQPYNETMDGTKGGFNAAWYDDFIPDADLQKLAASGARHIRLPVDPEPFMDMATGALNMQTMPLLEKALARIRAAGLAVMFNPHPKMPTLKGMRGNKDLPPKFIRWSAEMAAWLDAHTDPEWVFYEPLNEPAICGYYLNDWIPLQDQLIVAIREKAPRHTLILNAGGFQLPWELKNFPVHPDRNAVYAVHYYYPSQFSHQGAVWMSTWYHPLRQVPWPFGAADLPGIIARLDHSGKNAEYTAHAEKAMKGAVAEGVGQPGKIDEHFKELAEWSTHNKRRIVVNEFGVLKTCADEESRARWLQYVRDSSEKNNFGWSHWEYQQQMGFATGKPGERQYEIKAGRALGFVK